MKITGILYCSLFALALTGNTLDAKDRYMTLNGAGSMNGDDWANAYASSSFNNVLNTITQAGDTLYLEGADYGTVARTITNTGTSAGRKSLIGVDRGAGLPVFKGPGLPSDAGGTPQFVIAANVSYWTLKNLRFESRWIGLQANGNNNGLILEGVSTKDTWHRGMVFNNCDNILLLNCSAQRYMKMGMHFQNGCNGVTLKNCYTNASGHPTGSDGDIAFRNARTKDPGVQPVGFNFNDTDLAVNRNILIEDCESLNNYQDTPSTTDYEQGDGIKTEGNNEDITIRRCYVHDNDDAGMDLKGSNQVIEDSVGARSREGFKVWYQGTLTNCIAVDNTFSVQVTSTGTGALVNADLCTFHNGAIEVSRAGNTINLNNCLLTRSGSTGSFIGSSSLGTENLNGTVTHLNTSDTLLAPRFVSPVTGWNGVGTNFNNATYGLAKGYSSTRVGAVVSVVIDNDNAKNSNGSTATKVGTWVTASVASGSYEGNYDHDDNTGKGTKSFTFTPNITSAGMYKVYARWTAASNRAPSVPIDITYPGGVDAVAVNQRNNNNQWMLLGTYTCFPATTQRVVIRTTGTTGYVISDAVKFER